MSPIRILHVFGRLDRGGAETMVMNLYRNIDRSLIQFDFAVHTNDDCDYDKEITELGGRIYHFPRFNGMNIIEYINCWEKFLYTHKEYKIIHGHMYSIASVYLYIAKKYGCYTIAHSHNTSNGKGLKALIKDCFCFPLKYICDYKMACGIEAAKWLFGQSIYQDKNFHLLKNAINIDEYCQRNLLNLDIKLNKKVVLGHIGRFVELKNHKFLIEVFFEYHKLNSNSVLLLLGTGELENAIKEIVVRFDLEKVVLFLGVRENVEEYLKKMDAFVFPSIYEGVPMVLVEAQAAGLQCFISNTISDEVCITGCINKLSLKENARKWAEYILKKQLIKQNTCEEIRNAGYDIAETTKWLSNFYISHYSSR